MKDNIAKKTNIYYKMNCQTLKYNIIIPFFFFLLLSFGLTIASFILNCYIDNNIKNSIQNRTFYSEITNKDEEEFISELKSVLNVTPVIVNEDKAIYKVVINDYLQVDSMISYLYENRKILSYRSLNENLNTQSKEQKEPVVIFYNILRFFHIAITIVFSIIIAILTVREFDAEILSRKYLKLFAYKKCQVITSHILVLLKVLFYFLIGFVCFLIIIILITHKLNMPYIISLVTIVPFFIIYLFEAIVFYNYTIK